MKAAYTRKNMWNAEGRKHGSLVAKEAWNNRHLPIVPVLLVVSHGDTYHLEKKENTFNIRQEILRRFETHRGRDVSKGRELRAVLKQS
jgi:hypothetical protein